jgi:hypothetical protein
MEGDRVSSSRLVLRFVVGTAEIVVERLSAALRVFEERCASSTETLPWPTLAPRHVLLGALSAAPAGLQSALTRARPLADRVSRTAGRGLQSLGRVPGGKRLQAACHDASARTRTQIARWAMAGLQEEMAARSLARTALPELFELTMARLADSPDLQELLQDQTQGLTAAAMNRLRAYSEGADRAAQGFLSRLLRREPTRTPRPVLSSP